MSPIKGCFGHHLSFFIVVLVHFVMFTARTQGLNCDKMSIGVEAKGIIPDNSFTASSFYDHRYKPHFARLLSNTYGWDQKNPQTDNNQYLQIDLGFEYFVCAIATKAGRSREYVKTYKIETSTDKIKWTTYKEDGQTKIFTGNKDSTSIVKSFLKNKPLMRHIRLYPLAYYEYKSIKLAIYGYSKFQVCILNPLGMQSGDILDDQLSASSSQASNSRLYSSSSWCPMSHDSSPYLQVDLGSDHVICAVATQGSSAADKWVTSYHISTSSDALSWTLFQENNSSVARVFYGNYDRSTVVRQVLYQSLTTRYLRIIPKTLHGGICLRLEIYGYHLQPICSKHSVGVPSPIIVPDHRFTATSYYSSSYKPSMARLEGSKRWWSSTKTDKNQFLEIDLGYMFRVCAVLTQGDPSGDYWVKKYKIRFSVDNRIWKTYTESNGIDKIFQGNSDRSTIVSNSIKYPFKAKFVRVAPTDFYAWVALRVDFKGTAEACASPLGLENNKEIINSQMTSSSMSDSSHSAPRGRLYDNSAWCSRTTSKLEYLQVDLQRVMTVTGIATQGDPSRDNWVTSYTIGYRFTSIWYEYREGQTVKVFPGNSNRNDVIANWLIRPIAARHVRIVPQASRGGYCMRFDLYGCEYAVSPKTSIDNNDVVLPSIKGSSKSLKCTTIGEPLPNIQWFRNDKTKINGAVQNIFPLRFTSAYDIVSTYGCKRQNLNTRPVICKMNYTCTATFPHNVPSTESAESSARATVYLNVPPKQVFSVVPGNKSLLVSWTPVRLDDVGNITGYTMYFSGKYRQISASRVWGRIKDLIPYTNYTLRMKADSVVGQGLWSDAKIVATLIAEPESRPVYVKASVTSSTTMTVSWTFYTSSAKVNGPLAGFRIFYIDSEGTRNTKLVGGIARSAQLTGLKKYTEYSVTVAVWNTVYNGPESSSVKTRTSEDAPDCPPQLKSVQALSSTSVRVTWEPLPDSSCRNGKLRGYRIIYRRPGVQYVYRKYAGDNDNTIDIINLSKYTTYVFTVIAYTIKDSNSSNAINRRTLQDAPSAPRIKESSVLPPQGSTRVPRVKITWYKPSEENGIITRYNLLYGYEEDIATQKKINITDFSTLTYTMDVFGEAFLVYKISASTIKEGPYSGVDKQWIPAFAPATAPKGVIIIKQNETMFTVTWQPLSRSEANGVITMYRLTWMIVSTGRFKRTMTNRKESTGTTKQTQFTLYPLRLCAQYEIRVAALTKAGPGPNASKSIFTSQPGEPYSLRSDTIGKRSISVKWKKPRGISEDVKSYKIFYKGSKPSYWPEYTTKVDEKGRDGKQTVLAIENLQPATRYEFWVIASTVCGESNKSLTMTAETQVDKPETPKGNPINLKDEFNVTLWTVKPYNGPISSYQVIIIIGDKKTTDQLPEKLNDYKQAEEKEQDFYITAEVESEKVHSTPHIVIGDNKMYGVYKNVPLDKGQIYTVIERVITRYRGGTYQSDAVHIATIKLSSDSIKSAKSKTGTGSGVIIGVVFALLIVLVVVAFLGVRYKRNRKAKNDDSRDLPLDDVMGDEPIGANSEWDKPSCPLTGNNDEKPAYVNVGVSINPATKDEAIYDEASGSRSLNTMTKRQFLEYMKTLKSTNYAELKEEFKTLLNTHVHPVDIAKKPANKRKNRYANIVTYNHSRVVLGKQENDENSDYINASYIKGYDGSTKTYIATQGPTALAIADFWQMIWEQNSYTIVMLTKLKEGPKAKCHQYWPENKEIHRDITVTIHKTEVFPDYIVRTILLVKANTNESRQINHFQFTVWPDKGVPHYATAVLGFRRQVKAANPNHAGPIVVHCSAGVGRTGAYIVIDAMLDRSRQLKDIDICTYVATIRNDRPYMVQTDEQYVFIHLALYEAFTCGNTEIPVFNLQTTIRKLSAINPQKNVSGYELEFERLNRVTEDYNQDECDIGNLPENKAKNRYKENIVLNHSRVLLSKTGETVESSYINASHVDAYKERNAFLVTQAPLQNTIEDFWIMVVNYDVRTIVMLNTLHEEHEQFIQYWPDSGSTSYGNVVVEMRDTKSMDGLISQQMAVTYDKTTVLVQHIQMTNWTDKCCPTNSQLVLELMNDVEQSQRQASSSPMVVQCSNGIGRSGTFCAIYSTIERVKQEQVIDVFQTVKRIRTNRVGAVESLAQYVFCYQIIEVYLDSFSDYANFTN